MPFRESLEIDQRIQDQAAQAVDEFNLGHVYKDLVAVRDLDAAEAAYQRSLDLRPANDTIGRAKTLNHLGMVYHDRFGDARKRDEPVETLFAHAAAAEKYYLEGLRLCPNDAFGDLAPKHGQLGNFYRDLGQLDDARHHYEENARYAEKIGDRFQAGQTRYNMALMYGEAATAESEPARARVGILRAHAYAEAALRDYKYYQGRASDAEAETLRFLAHLKEILQGLP